jgi:hypothetical protein
LINLSGGFNPIQAGWFLITGTVFNGLKFSSEGKYFTIVFVFQEHQNQARNSRLFIKEHD